MTKIVLFGILLFSTPLLVRAQVQSPAPRDNGTEVQGQPPVEMQSPADPGYSGETQGVRDPNYGESSRDRSMANLVWFVLVLAVVGVFVAWYSRRRRGVPTGEGGNPRI